MADNICLSFGKFMKLLCGIFAHGGNIYIDSNMIGAMVGRSPSAVKAGVVPAPKAAGRLLGPLLRRADRVAPLPLSL